jgi:hypothetical protein
MGIRDDMGEAMGVAVQVRDMVRVEALKMARRALHGAAAKAKGALSYEEEVRALLGEILERRRAARKLRREGRRQHAETAEAHVAILEEFLPEEVTDAELEIKIQGYLADHPDAAEPKSVAEALRPELRGAVDEDRLVEACRRVINA